MENDIIIGSTGQAVIYFEKTRNARKIIVLKAKQHPSFFKMNRTTVMPCRPEEKELGQKLYRKLNGLMLLHAPTDELKKCLSADMFQKTNHHAFFQVMSYLFRLHDPAEFKKRFYWPIIDKRAESHFRSASVDYLKQISEKHLLNWNIKSYLFVMPGGLKLITFLLDFVSFIVREQVRLREKHLAEFSQAEIKEMNPKRMQRQNEFFKDFASNYLTEISLQTVALRDKTELIRKNIKLIEETNSNCVIDKNFLELYEQSNNALFQQKYITQSDNVVSMEAPLTELKTAIEKFHIRTNESRIDSKALCEALRTINHDMASSPITEVSNIQNDAEDSPAMNCLLAAFVKIQPSIENWLSAVLQSSYFASDSVSNELNALRTELEQIECRVVDFQKTLTTKKLKHITTNRALTLTDSPSLLKYIQTPPIKLMGTENTNTRLPINDGHVTDISSSFLGISRLMHERKRNQSSDCNATLNRSKIIDPSRLLRSIHTKKSAARIQLQPQQRENLTVLGLKWKERQQLLFDSEKTTATKANVAENNSTDHQTPKTPFNTSKNDITCVAYSSPTYELNTSLAYKKSTVVRKVQDATLNIQNLSTSPSGRLESLAPEYAAAKPLRSDDNQQIFAPDENQENNANLTNAPFKFPLVMDLEDDAIFNTSDTLLQDII